MADKELPKTEYSQTNITVNHHHYYAAEETACSTDESWSDETITLVSGIIYSVITVAVPLIVTALSSQPKNVAKQKRQPSSKYKQLPKNN